MYTLTDSYYFSRVLSECHATYQCPLVWMEKTKLFKLDDAQVYLNRSKWILRLDYYVSAMIFLALVVANSISLDLTFILSMCFFWFASAMNLILDFTTFRKRVAYVQILNSNLIFPGALQGKSLFFLQASVSVITGR